MWGDSGLYYCLIITPDDVEGKNEEAVELLVLGKTSCQVAFSADSWCIFPSALSLSVHLSVHHITMGVRSMSNSSCSTFTVSLHLVQSFTPRRSGWQMLPNKNSNVYTHTAHTLHRRKWLQKVKGCGKSEPLFLRHKTINLQQSEHLRQEFFKNKHPEDIESYAFCSLNILFVPLFWPVRMSGSTVVFCLSVSICEIFLSASLYLSS